MQVQVFLNEKMIHQFVKHFIPQDTKDLTKHEEPKHWLGCFCQNWPPLTSIIFINRFVFRRQLRYVATKAKKVGIFEKDRRQTVWSLLFCLGFRRSKRCFFNIWTTFFNFCLSAATAAWRRRDDRINTYTLNFSMKNDPCGISNDYLASLKLELPSAV